MAETQRLSKFDALFLNTDTDKVSMQIGVPMPFEGAIDFERYLEWLAPRIEEVPRLRQVVASVPFQLRYPAWTPYDAFDLREHVRTIRLEAPGTDEQLWELFTELYGRRLDRDIPLWRLYVIEGREGNRSAMFISLHHCIGDAQGIYDILEVLFQPPPEGWVDRSASANRRESDSPGPMQFFRMLASREGWACMRMMLRYLVAPGPWFPFNRPPSGRVRLAQRKIPAEELQSLARAFNATVTDIVFAMLAGGLDRYAADHGVAVRGKFLRLQVPANMRAQKRFEKYGNALGMLPVLVPLGIEDPVERIARIAEHTRATKKHRMSEFMLEFMSLGLTLVTPPGQALMGKLFTSKTFLSLSRRFSRSPREHMLMSSMVMPPVVYHADGQPASAIYAIVPCQFNMGLICTALSYRDCLHLLLVGDEEHLPDLPALMEHVQTALAELRAAKP